MPELRVLQVHDAGNSLEALLWVFTMQNAKVGRLSVLLASDDMGWVTRDAERQPWLLSGNETLATPQQG